VSDITERLQNFYENNRRTVFLNNKGRIKTSAIDISARNFKHKYLIEQTYTYLDYRFFTSYMLQNDLNLLKVFKSLSDPHIKRLVHNVFPLKNNSLLHYIAQSPSGFLCIDHLTNLSKKEGYVVPFLINSEEVTPLDTVVTRRDHKSSNSMVRMLSKAPMDHHSRFISHLIPKLIDLNLPALEKYFDKRKYQTGVCKTITVGKLKVSGDHN
jgi:hypothetical protein